MQLKCSDDSGQALGAELQKRLHTTKMFKIKVHEDTYNDETRVKYTMQSCEPMNWDADSKVCLCVLLSRPFAAAAHCELVSWAYTRCPDC